MLRGPRLTCVCVNHRGIGQTHGSTPEDRCRSRTRHTTPNFRFLCGGGQTLYTAPPSGHGTNYTFTLFQQLLVEVVAVGCPELLLTSFGMFFLVVVRKANFVLLLHPLPQLLLVQLLNGGDVLWQVLKLNKYYYTFVEQPEHHRSISRCTVKLHLMAWRVIIFVHAAMIHESWPSGLYMCKLLSLRTRDIEVCF